MQYRPALFPYCSVLSSFSLSDNFLPLPSVFAVVVVAHVAVVVFQVVVVTASVRTQVAIFTDQ